MTRSLRSSSLLLAACLAACAEDAAPPAGRLAVALVASDNDTDASYRLIAGTRLEARIGTTLFDSFPLDGDTLSIVIELPVGTYEFRLAHDIDFGTEWPLDRIEADGSETRVTARLVTMQPMVKTIQEGVTVPLDLEFRLAASGTITFAFGSLAVSADVDVVAAGGAELHFGADQVTIASATIHPDAPASLASYWPAAGASGLFASASGFVGSWSLRSSSRACATLFLDGIGATPDTSFFDLVVQAATTSGGEVCIDAAGPAQRLEVSMERQGPATTGPLQDFNADFLFVVRLAAELPEPVLVDGALDLSLIDWGHFGLPLTGSLEVSEGPGGMVPWYDAALTGTAAFTHIPVEE
jgi:hypothetical protein